MSYPMGMYFVKEPKYEVVELFWKRVNKNLEIRQFSEKHSLPFFRHQMFDNNPLEVKMHVIYACVINFNVHKDLAKIIEDDASKYPHTIANEVYDLCLKVNPFFDTKKAFDYSCYSPSPPEEIEFHEKLKYVGDLNHKVVKKLWERTKKYIKVRQFREEQRGEIFDKTTFLYFLRDSYESFIFSACVVDADSFIQSLYEKELKTKVDSDILVEEVYELCIKANPFLAWEKIDDYKLGLLKRQLTKQWWERIEDYIDIVKFEEDDILIESYADRETHEHYIVYNSVVDSESFLHWIMEETGLTKKLSPKEILHEIYQLCIKVNPFLSYEAVYA